MGRMFRRRALLGAGAASSLLTGLGGYWPLSDLTDASGHGYTLTKLNNPTFGAGKVGNAAYLSAAGNQALLRADNADLQTGDIYFTFDAWVYADTLTTARVVGSKSLSTTQREWTLFWDSGTGFFTFRIYDSGGAAVGSAVASSFGAISLGTWYHVLGWHDPDLNVVGVAVNGVANTGATTGVITGGAWPFTLGAHLNGTLLLWDGRIDEAGFWRRQLTAAEKLTLYNGGSGNTYPSF
jgi:hypothetical protein